ncbi:efflux RND transporter periplasmic adaptor subunit [Kordiimonas lipolytica]|uniref:Efflux RND transporter periplasmic adaptor subunit n=1 Tax=Kordiimonas lipolytica TaxID=1662421 RepID=A0ABV8U730_9PROT|nr:efflux RND transporter periplasmic adaptor subunit [Kordiimonas lipolytica]
MNKTILIAATAAALGLAGGYMLAGSTMTPSGSDAAAEKKPLYWVAPMDSSYRRDGPGKSPMGMDLVPVYEEGAGGTKGYAGATVDPRIVNNIGVKTTPVERAMLMPVIDTVGKITYDEKATAHVHVRADGWVEKLHVRAEGERVKKGDALFDVYSPELVTAQSEYLQARTAGRSALVASARERLVGLGLTDAQIGALDGRSKPWQTITVRAPLDGTVTMLNVSDAARITAGKPAMQITNLDKVWLIADVFEADMTEVRIGAKATATSDATGETVFESTVDHIYPDLNKMTRTNPVRILLDNPDGRLRPGMYMRIRISRPMIEDTLVVPATALIRLGSSNHVMLAEGDGKFRPAEVTVGETVGSRVQILGGLRAGERVVTAGQFMLDAESSFQGASMRMSAPEQAMEDMAMEEPEPQSGFTSGTINEVMLDERTLNISHGPIDAFDMMGMTMIFPVSDDVDMSTLEAGQEIHFEVTKTPEGRYLVTTIHVMGGHE